jgi:hypothetical protein
LGVTGSGFATPLLFASLEEPEAGDPAVLLAGFSFPFSAGACRGAVAASAAAAGDADC